MTEQQARDAVAAIIADLSDRRGIKGEWLNIDEDIQQEIRETWVALILDASREDSNA